MLNGSLPIYDNISFKDFKEVKELFLEDLD